MRRRAGGTHDYVSTGDVAIKRGTYGPAWRDLRKLKVEDRLNEAMASFIAAAFDHRRQKREAEEDARLVRVEEARRAELRRLREEEEQAVATLRRDANDWRNATLIRRYVRAAERSEDRFSDDDSRQTWVAWARAQADRIDPLTPSPPSVLDQDKRELRPLNEIWFDDDQEL